VNYVDVEFENDNNRMGKSAIISCRVFFVEVRSSAAKADNSHSGQSVAPACGFWGLPGTKNE